MCIHRPGVFPVSIKKVNSVKKILLILLFWFVSGAPHASSLLMETKKATENANLVIVGELNPNQLVEDLNGDGKKDIVLFVEDKKTRKKGICILHSGSTKCVILGAGKEFYSGGDDFRWVDHWEIIPEGETWETTFNSDGDVLGEKKVILENKSIRLCVDEGGCGVITFNKGSYIWVHQGD